MKKISQPGQCATTDVVAVKGPKGEISNVRVMGPLRKHTQLEILRSDNFLLGINAPIRLSGDLKRSERLTIIGPKGKVDLINGVIVAQRHLHITVAEAKDLKLKDGQKISIKTHGDRGLIFNNVLIRTRDDFALDFHIDIDEANAAGLNPGDWGEIIR